MAKKIELETAAQQEAKVQKLLEKRADRLKTKKYPRPHLFAEEMKLSESQYRRRVAWNAAENYVKRILKAAGLATEETTQDARAVYAGNGDTRTGCFMQAVGDNVVSVSVHGTTDEHAYMNALNAYGLNISLRYAPPSKFDCYGFARATIVVRL